MEQRWLGVEVRHLAALQAIAAERSFRAAAERLGYGQSAISQQLSALERLVGARLVERTRGRPHVELTEAGTVLLHHADRVVATLRAARADLDSLTADGGKRLRLGVFPSVAARFVPEMLARLALVEDELRIDVSEAPCDSDLFEPVACGTLDCAFGELPLEDGPFASTPVMTDPCVLVVHRDSPLARRHMRPSLREIAQLPLAYPKWRTADLVRTQLRAAGVEPARTFALETGRAAQGLARAGLAAAIMPALAVDPHDPGIVAIDLAGMLPSRTLALYWHEGRIHPSSVRTLVNIARATCDHVCAPHGPPTERTPTASTDLRRAIA